LQSASALHPEPVGVVGLQTPLSHVNPSPHGVVAQLVRHCPSAQSFPSPHSLEYLQTFCGAVQEPATQVSPSAQSVFVAHGQGPSVPPHVSHLPALQVLPSPQSALVVHSLTAPGGVLGAEQAPLWHVSPRGQLAFV
jgi:hypothetical protein